MAAVDISVIVNLHREGLLAHASLLSVARAAAAAEKLGLHVETIAVLDKPDQLTLDYANARPFGIQVVAISAGDTGPARNVGVEAAGGEFVALIDGDDLWAENWLTAAYQTARQDGRAVIWHPRANIYFGEERRIFLHVDMEDDDFSLLNLALSNYWTAATFAQRAIHQAIPFPCTDPSRQLGYEDWSWHLMTAAQGHIHKCVPGTIHGIRAKLGSRVRSHAAQKSLPGATPLFRDVLLSATGKSDAEAR